MKFFNIKTTLAAFLLLIAHLSFAQKKGTSETSRVAFYNVENLFDTRDNPNTKDEEFTPDSKKKWTKGRYYKKINDLAAVVDAMEQPDFLGFCEVENERVLKDFVAAKVFKNKNYKYVHENSPDARGIDVAFVYDSTVFEVTDFNSIRINFPDNIAAFYTTRDVLVVKGVWHKTDTLHFYINHWPSRRGGLKASEPKRVYVAQMVKENIDEVFSKNADANIIVMGDFNDEPMNKSIQETLNAQPDSVAIANKGLYNCMYSEDVRKMGSYNYRGNWNMLDQFIVSSAILDKKDGLYGQNSTVFQQSWMMYQSEKNGLTPSRTYGGPNYYGGISDHLPIYIDLVRKR